MSPRWAAALLLLVSRPGVAADAIEPSMPLVLPPGVQAIGTADLQGDGTDELVTFDRALGAVSVHHEGEAGWTLEYRATLAGEFLEARLIDVDGDGTPEIIARTLIGVLVVIDVDERGNFVEQRMAGDYPAGTLCFLPGSEGQRPTLLVGASTFPSRVFRFELAEDRRWTRLPPLQGKGGDVVVACGDVDGDGRDEVVFTDNHYWTDVMRLYVFEGDDREHFLPRVDGHVAGLTDIDGDGRLEALLLVKGATETSAVDVVTGERHVVADLAASSRRRTAMAVPTPTLIR